MGSLLAAAALAVAGPTGAGQPAQLTRDAGEARAALAILDEEAAGRPVPAGHWRTLFATAPYQALKAREAAMGRTFTDADFQAFLRSRRAIASRAAWRATLAAAEAADMAGAGAQALAWLPQGATVRARVYPEIKPRPNSFVWGAPGAEPAIFLYLEPQSTAKFQNTVTHECHHIGLASLSARQDAVAAGLPEPVRRAMTYLGAFGEGEAMLAAAGSPERHPHWEDDAAARARWDGDAAHFNADLRRIEALLTDIVDGRLTDDAAIRARAAPFWGDVQGAWYTVGYEMAVLVYLHDGKPGLDAALIDPRELLIRYDHVAAEADRKGADLALWTPALLAKLSPAKKT